ncbi:hypothetical protein [Gloeocapsopsis dulcis]|uniref:Uncharacterized protein n=1 Tax=Gloeocapsopsis dulcis AAB1 = 1H9 TaxID=1433147 RepID=A0A6N8FUE5_9CHRO|nr:hypothetical protein [Gloeocapsopsis dulcis]MUL36740.1 hypothetical protein [Gloeocapsopsis dulcis AAB1 = 1H9]
MKQSFSETKKRSVSNALEIDFTRQGEVLQIFPSGSLLSSQQGQWLVPLFTTPADPQADAMAL